MNWQQVRQVGCVWASAIALAACGGGGGGGSSSGAATTTTAGSTAAASSTAAPGTSTSPAPALAALDANLASSLSNGSVVTGQSFTLTWTSTSAADCAGSGAPAGSAWNAVQTTRGTFTETIASAGGPYHYTLTCTDGSHQVVATTSVAVLTPAQSTNTLPILIDGGLDGQQTDSMFVTVQICAPAGTGNARCATVSHILLDTGSQGLRIQAAALASAGLDTGSLPAEIDSAGNPVAECAVFGSSASWGAVRIADVIFGTDAGSERARAIAIQVENDGGRAYAEPPATCTSADRQDTRTAYNGVLGVRGLIADKQQYFDCAAAGGCTATQLPGALQVANPVVALPVDNNGVVISLGAFGRPTETSQNDGELILGVGTEPNNQLSVSGVFPTADAYLNITYQGRVYSRGVIDSGTSNYVFTDATLPACGAPDQAFFCPATASGTTALTVSVQGSGFAGATGAASTTFELDGVPSQPGTFHKARWGANYLSSPLSPGNNPTYSSELPDFVLGMPFFFGKTIAFVIPGAPAQITVGTSTVPATVTGPFIAF